jgi:putative transposase
MSLDAKITYVCQGFPPEIIQHAVWLYFRFTLSYHDLEDLLVERGGESRCRDLRRIKW